MVRLRWLATLAGDRAIPWETGSPTQSAQPGQVGAVTS
jgi:hypothetical protein